MIFRKELGPANVATLVERMSRSTVLLRNNDRRSKPLMSRLIAALSPLPQPARRSFTFDRGLEFVSWRELEAGMGTMAWFCDPQAPWQKDEPPRPPIRRSWRSPKSMFSICERLNAMPRQCLGYRTPAEVFRTPLLKEDAMKK